MILVDMNLVVGENAEFGFFVNTTKLHTYLAMRVGFRRKYHRQKKIEKESSGKKTVGGFIFFIVHI
jgi:hypothetical protein